MLVVEGKRRGEEGEVEGRGSGRDRGEGENRGKGGRGKSGGSGRREGMSRKILGLILLHCGGGRRQGHKTVFHTTPWRSRLLVSFPGQTLGL